MIDLNGIYRSREHIRSPFFLLVDCIMRWISRKLVSRRSCPSLNSNMHVRTRARTLVCVTRIRVHGHAGATWWTNVQWYCWPAGGLKYHVALRRQISNNLVVFKVSDLSPFEKKSYSFPSSIYLLLTKFLKIVWPFVNKKRQCGRVPSRVGLDAIECISLKIEIIVYL